MADPIAPYAGTETMNITSSEHNTHAGNFDSSTGAPTTRANVLGDQDTYGPSNNRKAIVVFFSRKAITDLVNDNTAYTHRSGIRGITITFGLGSNTFKLIARSSDAEGLCPSGLQDNNYKGTEGGILNSELTTLKNDFKSGGYTNLGSFMTHPTHPTISFNNVELYDLLFELTQQQRSGITGTIPFHVVISDKFSVQCLTLNGVSGTVFKEGKPCPPDCYV